MFRLTQEEIELVKSSFGKVTGRQLQARLHISYSTLKRLRRQYCEVSPDVQIPFGKIMDIKAECCNYCEDKGFCDLCGLTKFMKMLQQHMNKVGINGKKLYQL